MHKNVPDGKQLPTPFYTTNPSRIVQLLNMMSIEDLFDFHEVERIREDVLSIAQTYGEVLAIQIPAPLISFSAGDAFKEMKLKEDLEVQPVLEKNERLNPPRTGETALVSHAHCKVFIKFNHVVAAKQARYAISGRSYNGRTVVGAFYPEHLYDRGELNLI